MDAFIDDGLSTTPNQLPVDVSPAPPEIIVPAGPLNLIGDIPLEITAFALQKLGVSIVFQSKANRDLARLCRAATRLHPVHCEESGRDRVVAFSCRDKRFFTSCGGRRMVER